MASEAGGVASFGARQRWMPTKLFEARDVAGTRTQLQQLRSASRGGVRDLPPRRVFKPASRARALISALAAAGGCGYEGRGSAVGGCARASS
eukprot:258345-Chlamydomonas_euryale.AAC.2